MASAQLGFSYYSAKYISELFVSIFSDSKAAAYYAIND
ncbi:unnamed protein product, partial [Rotaria magnacalcarata]